MYGLPFAVEAELAVEVVELVKIEQVTGAYQLGGKPRVEPLEAAAPLELAVDEDELLPQPAATKANAAKDASATIRACVRDRNITSPPEASKVPRHRSRAWGLFLGA
jgi:hypothetical protein